MAQTLTTPWHAALAMLVVDGFSHQHSTLHRNRRALLPSAKGHTFQVAQRPTH